MRFQSLLASGVSLPTGRLVKCARTGLAAAIGVLLSQYCQAQATPLADSPGVLTLTGGYGPPTGAGYDLSGFKAGVVQARRAACGS